MNLDQLGQRAGAEIRRVTALDAPSLTRLDELERTDARRRRSGVVLVVSVSILVVVLGWLAVHGPGHAGGLRPVGPAPTSSAAPAALATEYLTHPVTVTFPAGWYGSPFSGTTVDFLSAARGYGVSITEGVSPAARSSRIQVDPSGGTTAQSTAAWMAARPFLVSSPVTATTVGGLPAWQVDVRLKPNQASINRRCGYYRNGSCVPLLVLNGPAPQVIGIWADGRIRFVFVDLPGVGTTVVWTWDFDNDSGGFAPAQVVVDSLRFSGG